MNFLDCSRVKGPVDFQFSKSLDRTARRILTGAKNFVLQKYDRCIYIDYSIGFFFTRDLHALTFDNKRKRFYHKWHREIEWNHCAPYFSNFWKKNFLNKPSRYSTPRENLFSETSEVKRVHANLFILSLCSLLPLR